MKRFLASYCFIILCWINLNAQATFKVIRHNSQNLITMIPAIGNGYFLLGGTDTTFITRLDSNLNFIWQKSLSTDSTKSFFQCHNGDLVYTGRDANHMFVTRTDSLTNVLWSKQYLHGAYWSEGVRILEHSNNDLYILGTALDSSSYLNPTTLLMKLDSTGNFIWAKENATQWESTGRDLAESSDHQILFGDMQQSLNGSYAGIVKMDTAGMGIWFAQASAYAGIGPYGDLDDISITYDGGCVSYTQIANHDVTGLAILLTLINGSGSFLKAARYEFPNGQNSTWPLFHICSIQTADSGFAFCGITSIPGYNLLLIKLDSTLDVQWCRAYNTTFPGVPASYLEQTFDGGFIIGTNNQSNTAFIKTDPYGNSNCNDTVITVSDTILGTGVAYPFLNLGISPLFISFNSFVTDSSSIISTWDTICYSFVNNFELMSFTDNFNPSIFPNPSERQFTVNSEQHTIEKIQVLNAMGENIYCKLFPNTILNEVIIGCEHFLPGIYFITVTTENQKIYSLKLIIAR
jgi:hypothetical protein